MVLEVAQVHERETCERHAPRHGHEPLLESALCGYDAAYDAAEGQAYDAHRTVHKAHLSGSKSESALVYRVEEEGVDEFHELCFGQTVEQHEEYGHACLLLVEERLEGGEELTQYVACGHVGRRMV